MSLQKRLKSLFSNVMKYSGSAAMQDLADLSKKIEALSEENAAREQKKSEDMKKLSQWIDHTATEVGKMMANNNFPAKGQSFENATGIDMENFSRNDLKELQPALCALHNICREANVAVHLEGFDLLPRPAYTDIFNGGAYHLSSQDNLIGHIPALHIFIDTTQPYNYKINPYSDLEVSRLRNRHIKKPETPKQ